MFENDPTLVGVGINLFCSSLMLCFIVCSIFLLIVMTMAASILAILMGTTMP